jgi:DNA-binding GntR family transcriptional regulator
MDDRRAPYLQVADALRAAIRQGTFAPGDRLPTVTELAEQYGVAKMTVQRAVSELREEGLVMSWQGRGTFVRDRTDAPPSRNEDEVTYEAIMQRLDTMCDEMQQLGDRLSRLESQRESDPAAPTSQRGD